MPKNLAVLCPNPSDGTSLYRGHGPLSALRKTMPDLNLCLMPNNIDWSTLSLMDAVFMQRPFRSSDVALCEMIRRIGIPLWVDLDDDLFRVPSWNPCSHIYNDPKIQGYISKCLQAADIVSVSTPHLADQIASLNKRVMVIPNAWDDNFFPRSQQERQTTGRLVFWRGSTTHRKDLDFSADVIIDAAKRHPDVSWMFIGDYPWFADRINEQQVIIAQAMDPFIYFDFLNQVLPNIMIVPLEDCQFNRSKSNCAWIEGSYAGSVVLGPAWPEWAQPGVCGYQDQRQFAAKLDTLLDMPTESLDALATKSWHHIEQNLALSKVNLRRKAILEGLFNGQARR